MEWGFLTETLLLYCGRRRTHGPWDTAGSPFLILFSLCFISRLRRALICASHVHRPPATGRDYLLVRARDLLFSRSEFHDSDFLNCVCLPLYSYCLLRPRRGPTLLSPFLVRVATFSIVFAFILASLWFRVYMSTLSMGGHIAYCISRSDLFG
jgi:hypothetical protein